MGQSGKILKVLFVILFLASLCGAGAGLYFLQLEKMKTATLEVKLDEAQKRQKITAAKLEDALNREEILQAELDRFREQIASLSDEIEREREAKNEAFVQLDQLKQQLQQEASLKRKLQSELSRLKNEANTLNTQLSKLSSQNLRLEKKIKRLNIASQKVELGTIVVNQPQIPERKSEAAEVAVGEQAGEEAVTTASLPQKMPLKGRILILNRDYDFVVIDLGSNNGLSVGDIFSVYDQGNYVGDIKIEKLHESMSAAGFLSPKIEEKIKEGDEVIQKI
jgi:predicted  nucleic acid-binding Zn-ribbon protein